ncbi:hypothetical protein [Glutamicibacter sp.]|uniref:hypothetical protein n=1 Tax=Glutamicibacter sp. TaxID=1931995 RepID=UPI0028BEADEE|nr:hypothetical protein [Glutamicibacter sp.]
MGVDWTALEEALRVAALRHAAEVIDGHPEQTFYAVSLHGVSTEESDSIAMPLLALNSLQALARDRNTEQREQFVERGEDLDDPDDYEDRADAELVEGLSSDVASPDDEEAVEDEDDDEDLDQVLASIEADLDENDSESFYSDKWEPSDWHWSSIDLCEDPAAGIWSDAMTELASREGWEPTIKRYYQTLVAVAHSLRDELNARTSEDLVTYVADEDHAERLLQLCLSPEQLAKHFPQLGDLIDEH